MPEVYHLLALAHVPEGGRSMADWRPFGGHRLRRFLEVFNRALDEATRPWDRHALEQYPRKLDILPGGLPLLRDMLAATDPARIRVVVANLEALAEHERDRLNPLVTRLSAPVHFTQVNGAESAWLLQSILQDSLNNPFRVPCS